VILDEMEKHFPGVSKHLRFSKIYSWENALAVTPIGRGETVAHYRKNVGPGTRVFLAGDYAGMSFTEGAAETGMWAAERIMKYK
jgi:oxygen-dependent protoporphyrinogen oxidase